MGPVLTLVGLSQGFISVQLRLGVSVVGLFIVLISRIMLVASDLQEQQRLTVVRGPMAIIVNLDVMLAMRKKRLTDLSQAVHITLANLSILKNQKAKAIRLSTLPISVIPGVPARRYPGVCAHEERETNES